MIRTESEQFLNVNSWCSWCSHMVYVDNGFVLIKDMKAVYQLLSLMNSKNKKTSSLHMIIRKGLFDVLGNWRSVHILRFIKSFIELKKFICDHYLYHYYLTQY